MVMLFTTTAIFPAPAPVARFISTCIDIFGEFTESAKQLCETVAHSIKAHSIKRVASEV